MGWISVEDKLPEIQGVYLVSDGVDVDAAPFLMFGDGKSIWGYSPVKGKKTHWQPMPVPPREIQGK